MEFHIFYFLLLSFYWIPASHCGDPILDHLCVFQGEKLTIDCARDKSVDPFLHYRAKIDGEQLTYFTGGSAREEEAKRWTPRNEGKNFWYDLEAAEAKDGGEYDCDWSRKLDETVHYVNVVDKDSLICPKVPARVKAGEEIGGLECSIAKTGVLLRDWLNDKTKDLGFKFTVIEDQTEMEVDVVYEEAEDIIIAKIDPLKLYKWQNGTTLMCKFVSMHNTETSCTTSPIDVYCDESGDAVYCADAPNTRPPATDSANAMEASFAIFGLCALALHFSLA